RPAGRRRLQLLDPAPREEVRTKDGTSSACSLAHVLSFCYSSFFIHCLWLMRPLTLDDLLPLDEYAGRRREFFDSLTRYVDRHRRVRVGPRLTLLFENRQTLWFRVQEVLRIARLAEPQRVQQELDLYNRLLPGRHRLQAALLIEVADESRLT